jgi:hypothetical protein
MYADPAGLGVGCTVQDVPFHASARLGPAVVLTLSLK